MSQLELELREIFISVIDGLKNEMKASITEKGYRLSPLHFLILKNINEHQQCTAHSLSLIMHRDKAQITRLLNELMKYNLLVKQVNPADKRSQYLMLTALGSEYLAELEIKDRETIQRMCRGISDTELHTFLKVGRQMMENLYVDSK